MFPCNRINYVRHGKVFDWKYPFSAGRECSLILDEARISEV